MLWCKCGGCWKRWTVRERDVLCIECFQVDLFMISMMTIIWIVLVLRFQMMQRMDGLIAIAIDAGNLTDCAEDAAGR